MEPATGWLVLLVLLAGILLLWSLVLGAYFLVIALLERSDEIDECEAPLKALERIEAMQRHPSAASRGHRCRHSGGP